MYKQIAGTDHGGHGDWLRADYISGLHTGKDGRRWSWERGQGIHHYVCLPTEFNFILKEALKCLKQVCDTVGQKDLFGNDLIRAEGVSWWGECIESNYNHPDKIEVWRENKKDFVFGIEGKGKGGI